MQFIQFFFCCIQELCVVENLVDIMFKEGEDIFAGGLAVENKTKELCKNTFEWSSSELMVLLFITTVY